MHLPRAFALLVRLLLLLNATQVAFTAVHAADSYESRVRWLVEDLSDQLDAIKYNRVNASPRSLTNGALAELLLHVGFPAPKETPNYASCSLAIGFLRRFGSHYDMSFGGEAIPAVFHEYFDACFTTNHSKLSKDAEFFLSAINASLPQSIGEATSQERSYTNMYLMASVEAVLYGELVLYARSGLFDQSTVQRAHVSVEVGYEMWDKWIDYTSKSGIHEFVSPTYTNVQLGILYQGYIYVRPLVRRLQFEQALDYIWAEIAANYYSPSATLSGPHSRDYDFLLSHGMTDIDMYVVGNLPNMKPLKCEKKDPHCEGAPHGWNNSIGTGEAMTCLSLTLLNIWHERGYRVKENVLKLVALPGTERTVSSRFIGMNVTANGNEGRFGDTINFIRIDKGGTSGFAIGSASQDYITRTHSKFVPYPGDKLVNIVLGGLASSYQPDSHRFRLSSLPSISLQPDCFDQPYGSWKDYPSWSSIDKGAHLSVHPGNVQSRNLLLATLAIDTQDVTDGFRTSPSGRFGEYKLLQTSTILPLGSDECLFHFENGTTRHFNISAALANGVERPFDVSLPLGTTVIIRVNTAALGIKIFHYDRLSGLMHTNKDNDNHLSIRLLADKTGIELGAMRLSCEHFRAPQNKINGTLLNSTHLRYAALYAVETINSPESMEDFIGIFDSAEIVSNESTINSSTFWDVSVNIKKYETELFVRRNLTCSEQGGMYNQSIHTSWNCLVERAVNSSSIIPTTLEVDGVRFPTPSPLS